MKTLVDKSIAYQLPITALLIVLALTAWWLGVWELSIRWIDLSNRSSLFFLTFSLSVITSVFIVLPLWRTILRPLGFIERYNVKQISDCTSDDCVAMLIPEEFVSSGEIGKVMKSRNMMLTHLAGMMKEVQEGYRRIVKLEKLKDDLSQMIVHDLKNPLGVILLSLDVLEKGETLPVRQKEIVQQARGSGTQMVAMIQNLLDISKMEEGKLQLKPKSVDLGLLVKEIVEQLRQSGLAANREISVVIDYVATLVGDIDLLTRVIQNLLGNALKYTSRDGKIEIRIGKSDNDEALVSVKDDGLGIPVQFQSQIFEKFEQVETKKEQHRTGSGLGLTFCRLAVELHGGRIWVESESGKGSTFRFTLPFGRDNEPVQTS